MKRKINISVSILLALIIALVPAAAFCEVDAEDEIGNFGLYEMNFLNSLGIVSFTEGQLTESVTNEEFAGAASVIGGLSTDYFQDGVLDILVDGLHQHGSHGNQIHSGSKRYGFRPRLRCGGGERRRLSRRLCR